MGDHDHHNHDHHHDPLDYTAAKQMEQGKGHSGHGGHGGHGGGGHEGMAMSFYASCEATILFSGWTTSTVGQMFGSCLAIFLAAALYEGLKYFRERLIERDVKKEQETICSVIPTEENQVHVINQSLRSRMLSCAHIIQVALHILQVGFSYLLMLVFMTYNVWLCLAVVLGAGLGFFVFGCRRKQPIDRNEHCH